MSNPQFAQAARSNPPATTSPTSPTRPAVGVTQLLSIPLGLAYMLALSATGTQGFGIAPDTALTVNFVGYLTCLAAIGLLAGGALSGILHTSLALRPGLPTVSTVLRAKHLTQMIVCAIVLIAPFAAPSFIGLQTVVAGLTLMFAVDVVWVTGHLLREVHQGSAVNRAARSSSPASESPELLQTAR